MSDWIKVTLPYIVVQGSIANEDQLLLESPELEDKEGVSRQ